MAYVMHKPLLMILWKVHELNGAWSLVYPGETSYRRKDADMLEQNSKEMLLVLCFSGQPAVFCIRVGELLPINTTELFIRNHTEAGKSAWLESSMCVFVCFLP